METEADEDIEKGNIAHCIYTSAETIEFSHEDILALLKVARENNAKLNVTGILLYDSGSFFQVLEGPPKAVQFLYDKIGKDTRHERVTKLLFQKIEERDFAEWKMGYAGVTKEQLKTIDGLSGFLQAGNGYCDLDEGRAKTLLNAFKDGQWRSVIS